MQLEKVIGNSVTNNSAFSLNAITSDLAYAAGSVIVIYNSKKNKQTDFLVCRSNQISKPITCLTWSSNGKYLASGESGHQPSISIWDVSAKSVVCELKQHKFGVSCLAFSPNQKFLASVGTADDGFIYIWELQSTTVSGMTLLTPSPTPFATNKIQSKVKKLFVFWKVFLTLFDSFLGFCIKLD